MTPRSNSTGPASSSASFSLFIDSRRLPLATEEFVQSLEQFRKLVLSSDFKIRSYSEASLERFLNASPEKQKKAKESFNQFMSFFSQAEAEGIDLKDDAQLLRKVSKSMGLIFSDEVYSQVKSTDIIEIYNTDFNQIYRNLAFMNVCNYTLLDLLTHEPFELYERSLQINGYIANAAQTLLQRDYDLSPCSLTHIPQHLLREKFSEDRLTSLVTLKMAYPVYKWPRKLHGWLVIQHGEPVGELLQDVAFI